MLRARAVGGRAAADDEKRGEPILPRSARRSTGWSPTPTACCARRCRKLFREETTSRADQAEGDLRTARNDHRQVRGRRQHHRRHRAGERVSAAHATGDARVRSGLGLVALLVALALVFDFMNGFHDAANSIATVVSTGVLKPQQAVAVRGVLQLRRDFIFHLKVAATVGKGIVDPAHRRPARRSSARWSARSAGTSSPGTTAFRRARRTR